MVQLTVRNIGDSLGVILPAAAVASLKVSEGDKLFLVEGPDGFRVTPYNSEFAKQMAVATKGMPLSDVLEETRAGIWADSESPDEIAAGLLRALALPALSPEEVQKRWHERFHYRSLTARLAACFHDLA